MKYLALVLLLLFCSCIGEQETNPIVEECYKLKTITRAKQPAVPGEWLAVYKEAHESLTAYCAKGPTQATNQRAKLYVVQLGTFDSGAIAILDHTKTYLQAFFQIPVSELPAIDIKVISSQHLRSNIFGPQIKTRVLLDSLLPALLPDSAFALIAFSLYDLYPADDWNFVFGQASLERRVGVWSLSRLGDYNLNAGTYRQCLKRTLHIAAHETGHMFGITHCVENECCMNGSNSLAESDQQPMWLCWECLAKVCMNRKISPRKHITALKTFHNRVAPNDTSTAYYEKASQLLKQ